MEILKTILIWMVPVILALAAAPLGKVAASLVTELINKIKHESLRQAAWVLVRAIEDKYLDNEEKYNYVFERLFKKFPWASELKIKEFIEACVKEMKQNLGNVEGSLTEPLKPLSGDQNI